MARMRNCPFCQKDVNDDFFGVHFNKLIGKWIFNHACDPMNATMDVDITVYGKTEQEVIDKWNGVQHEQEHLTD